MHIQLRNQVQYDQLVLGGNNDGMISAEDNIWPYLGLWLDANADGVSIPVEMHKLTEFGIIELEIKPKINNRHDPAGNWMPFWSWATNDNTIGNRKYKMIDVFFKRLATD